MPGLLLRLATLALGAAAAVRAQQIYDVYTTTWDRSQLFTPQNLKSPINFVKPGAGAAATIAVQDTTVHQPIDGFGATITDTAAAALVGLKNANSGDYWQLLHTLFDATDSDHHAALSFIRVTLGASDLSPSAYSFADISGDSLLAHFSLGRAANMLQVLKDIMGINPRARMHLVPWSPPAWMKTHRAMAGGGLDPAHYGAYAAYLARAVGAFRDQLGAPPYAIAIQNEPQNGDGTYPTCAMSVDAMGQVATQLHANLAKAGLGSTKIIGFEHNWASAATYPVQLMQKYGNVFAGVAFHCYEGSVGQQQEFISKFPKAKVYHTECTGTIGSDWWSDIKWFMDNLFIGAVENGARTAMLWNLAANAKGGPTFPGTDSCGGGCRPVVTISGGSYTLNQEFYAMAHAQKATAPRDVNGPAGTRIGASVSGGEGWALRVSAYETGRANAKDWTRYSLVVLNWNDEQGGKFKPQAIKTSISFRGMQAVYTFPVGVTTLWWYAPAHTPTRRAGADFDEDIDADAAPAMHAAHDGAPVVPPKFVRVREREANKALSTDVATNGTLPFVPAAPPGQARHIRRAHNRLGRHH